jgi:cell shape-determining protein MreC
MCGGQGRRLTTKPIRFFSVLEAFSFLLSDGKWPRGCQQTMKPPTSPKDSEQAAMEQTTTVQKISEEFINFRKTMEELYMLKRVASDLKSYRRMIKLKKYD